MTGVSDAGPEDWAFNREAPGDPPLAVYVDQDGAQAMGVESVKAGESIWKGWDPVERATVEEFFAIALKQLAKEPHDKGVAYSPDHRNAALVQSVIAELVDSGQLDSVEIAPGMKEAKYDNRDPRWTGTAMRWLREKMKIGRFDWIAPEGVTEVPDDFRLAILGDWGSGRYGAPRCAESIVGDATGFDAVVHLGDVYYSGTGKEVRRNFLQVWPWQTKPRRDGHDVLFRACNSNHEMYAGGKPYRKMTLREFDQQSSAFVLRNSNWLFIGLDTAYDEWRLAEGQEHWLRRLLASAENRRAVLFSHHQPLSHLSAPDDRFVELMHGVVKDYPGKIHAWYWGHEHLAAMYDRDDRLGLHGRCVGHSGFPYFRDEAVRAVQSRRTVTPGLTERLVTLPEGNAPRAVVLDGPNPHINADAETEARYGPNGYMAVHFNDSTVEEELLTPEGEVVWRGAI